MSRLFLLVLGSLLLAGMAAAYDLPEVIGVIEANPRVAGFATDFCCAGNLGGDPSNDLLIRNGGSNRAELYFGGQIMDDEFDFSFLPILPNQNICYAVNYLGNIIPGQPPYIALHSLLLGDPNIGQVNLYECGEILDDIPEFTLQNEYFRSSPFITVGYNTRPADVDGDGVPDFICMREDFPAGKFMIFLGGEDFLQDTIPDWEIYLHSPVNWARATEFSSGYDVDADGCHDILLKVLQQRENDNREVYWYYLYLGGSPMDTTPVFSFREDHFEGRFENRQMDEGFTLLPDVNSDGYADWGIQWREIHDRYDNDGFLIFFGSDTPDMVPDLDLEGHRRLWLDHAHIAGGDFNNDGVGDIVTVMTGSPPTMGEVHIHFGSPWIDSEADIYIDSEHDYDGRFFALGIRVGGIADYNNDSVDDIVLKMFGPTIVVLAGNEDWQVDVKPETLPNSHNLSLIAHPNPFNSILKIDYELPIRGDIRLDIYNIQGQIVDSVIVDNEKYDQQTVVWDATGNCAGIYFVRLMLTTHSEILYKSVKVVFLP